MKYLAASGTCCSTVKKGVCHLFGRDDISRRELDGGEDRSPRDGRGFPTDQSPLHLEIFLLAEGVPAAVVLFMLRRDRTDETRLAAQRLSHVGIMQVQLAELRNVTTSPCAISTMNSTDSVPRSRRPAASAAKISRRW